jgi:Raf kinase inhibitor-like YbhB/YbcL family protein
MPKSLNSCAAMGPRNKESGKMSARSKVWALIGFVLCFSVWPPGKSFAQEKGGTMSLQISSTAFSAGETIPKRFTCDGQDVSPQLKWNDPPANTQSIALIIDDPDAPVGTWVHWVLYDLPASARELPEGVAKQEQLSSAARQGRNDFGAIGYSGPCPPPGKPHRYFFKLYALDAKLGLKAGATKADVERAMKSHILAQTQLIGKYGR